MDPDLSFDGILGCKRLILRFCLTHFAVSVYVLIAIVKKELKLDASLYTLLQILSVSLFEKMPICQAFSTFGTQFDEVQTDNQLILL